MRKYLVVAAVAGVALVVAGVTFANHNYSGAANSVAVVGKEAGPGGNASCPSNTLKGPKIDPGANYSDAYITVTGYDGNTFDWAFTALANSSGGYDMAVAIVKGGPNSAIYTYDYTADPAFDDADNNLSAPLNPKSGQDYGISHIQFCYDLKGGGDN